MAVLEKAIADGYIFYNWDDPKDARNFDVLKADEFLSSLIGKRIGFSRPLTFDKVSKYHHVVECWKNGNYTHFRLRDWDSLVDSKTVRYGKIDSYRVFEEL